MVRKKKGKFTTFTVIILSGIVVVGFAFLDVQLPDIIPLSVIDSNRNINCDGVECRLGFNFGRGNFDGNPIMETIPLSEVDLNAPIIAEFRIEPVATEFNGTISGTNPPLSCYEFTINATQKINLQAFSLQAGSTVPVLTTSITEGGFGTDSSGRTVVLGKNIQPLLTVGQDILNLELVAGACDVGSGINYFVFHGRCFAPSTIATCSRGSSGAIINFLLKPLELQPNSNLLLEQNDHLQQHDEFESASSFAVAEAFQLPVTTVITDITMNIASKDLSTRVTAFIWNIDEVPPKRITQSITISGFGTQNFPTTFSFPDAKVLTPLTNYAVGIRVDGSQPNSFTYSVISQTANTHRCVIDRSPAINGETMFVSNGLCGIDISHNQFLAQTILGTGGQGDTSLQGVQGIQGIEGQQGVQGIEGQQGVQGIEGIEGQQGIEGQEGIQGESVPSLTRDELVAILCDGSETEPELCQRSVLLFTFLQIGDSSFWLLILIGVIIIVVGLIGIIVRRRK